MKLRGLGKLYSILYDDQMDVTHWDEGENDDETIDVFKPREPDIKDVKCRISFGHDDLPTDKDVDRDLINFTPKVFCDPEVDLRPGDYIVVRRYSDDGTILHTYMGKIGLPSWYSTHQEAYFHIDEEA